MQKFKLLIKCSLVFLLLAPCACSAGDSGVNHKENIQKYLELLKQDPGKCLYLEQIASSYQALNDFKNAIIYYKKAIDNCADDSTNTFQLGVCYLLLTERDLGINYMDQAIEQAQDGGQIQMAEINDLFGASLQSLSQTLILLCIPKILLKYL